MNNLPSDTNMLIRILGNQLAIFDALAEIISEGDEERSKRIFDQLQQDARQYELDLLGKFLGKDLSDKE